MYHHINSDAHKIKSRTTDFCSLLDKSGVNATNADDVYALETAQIYHAVKETILCKSHDCTFEFN